jgi:phospholipase/carboxylesterase
MTPIDVMKNVVLVTEGSAFDALGLVHRVRVPQNAEGAEGAKGERFPTLVMVHGFQGNEDVTWVFARTAGPKWLIVSPRAPIATEGGGYSWNTFHDGKTDPDSLWQARDTLRHFIDNLANVYPVDRTKIVLLGFSQGAGMCYTVAASQPQPPLQGLIALGGYIPGPVELPPLNGLPIFMFHGTKDKTIAVSLARKNHQELIEAGADVTYREDEVGHKVSAGGMRDLTAWLAQRLNV